MMIAESLERPIVISAPAFAPLVITRRVAFSVEAVSPPGPEAGADGWGATGDVSAAGMGVTGELGKGDDATGGPVAASGWSLRTRWPNRSLRREYTIAKTKTQSSRRNPSWRTRRVSSLIRRAPRIRPCRDAGWPGRGCGRRPGRMPGRARGRRFASDRW